MNNTSSSSTASTSTSSAPEITITAGPAVCSSANFDHCYDIESILTPTVYVIVTVSDSASAGGAEVITSGDPILTQSDNIITMTDQSVSAPTTAIVQISYSESAGTSCFPATLTTILTDSSQTQCSQAPGEPIFTAPPQVTKTRVFIKAREDDTQGKGTDQGSSSTAAPNGTSGNMNTDMAADTGTVFSTTQPAPTSNDSQTTEGSPQPTDSSNHPITSSSGSNPQVTGSTPIPINATSALTDSNNTPTGSSTTLLSGQKSSVGAPTGSVTNESGKPIVSTSFTTIAEVSNGSTKFVTSAVATMTIAGSSGSGAGSNFIFNGEVLLGAMGLAAFFGL
ncbi:hypothetical protein ABW20_dc0103098 [Dactylellina cionopaga]|nr:hypothetical protein ABW20_dc0103098 [Dactylellina cionopaga]